MTGALQVARLMQLAHAVKDANGRAYNRTKHLEQRHKMMQHWSDYLDGLQADNVVAVSLGVWREYRDVPFRVVRVTR